MTRRVLAPLFAGTLALVLVAHAEPPAEPKKDEIDLKTPKTEAAIEADRIAKEFRDFKHNLLVLKQRLEKSEQPGDREKAVILDKALIKVGTDGTDNKFAKLLDVLRNEKAFSLPELEAAMQQNKDIATDIRAILAILLTDDRDAELKRQIAEYSRMLEKLKEVIRQQENVRVWTDRNMEKNRLAKEQKDVTSKTEGIIKGNSKEATKSEAKPGDNKKGETKNGEGKGEAKNDTKDSKGENKDSKQSKELSKDGKPTEGKDAGKDNKDGKPSEAKDAGKDTKDGKPSEGKDAGKDSKDGKPSEGKDAGKDSKDGKPSEGKDAGKDSKDGKPSEGKDGGKDGKPSEGKDAGKDSKDGKPSEGKDGGKDSKDGKPSEGKDGGKDGKPSEGKDGEPGENKAGPKDAKPAGDSKSAGKDGGKDSGKNSKPSDGKPSGKPSDGKPGESKGEGKKPSEAKPSAGKPGDSKGKSEGKGEGKPNDSKNGKPSEGSPNKSGQQSPSQNKGQESPSQNKGQGNQQPGQQQSGSKGDGQPKSQQQGNQQPQDTNPAKKKIQDANDNQRRAQNELDKDNKPGASKEEQEAIKKLQEAQKKLEDLLRQLRQEEIERMLANLQNRCQRMLDMQLAVQQGTISSYKDLGEGIDKRVIEQKSNALSEDEDKIVIEAGKAISILESEGSAVAFPEVFKQVRRDMGNVATRLRKTDVGAVTQAIEKDIVDTLKEMIEALKKARQENQQKQQQQQQQQKQSQQGDQKLIEELAELKMIRSMQIRVNNRTETYGKEYPGEEQIVPENAADKDAREKAEMIQRELRELAENQDKIFDITKKIAGGKNK